MINCRFVYNALGHATLACGHGREVDTCPSLRQVVCVFCGRPSDAVAGRRGRCFNCGATIYGGRP